MQSARVINLRLRIRLSAMLMAASIGLAGCSTVTNSPSPSGSTPAATPATSAGYYQDEDAKYAITFPGKPSVQPVAGSDTGEMRASYSTAPDPTAPEAVYFIAGGTTASEVEILPVNLESILFRLINQGAVLTGPEQTFELEGMPALKNDITWTDGKPATIVLAGEGHSFYQLIVIGGTSEERQEFFDSFTLLSGTG